MSSIKSSNVRLNGVRLLIKNVSSDIVRSSGIIIPDVAKNDSRYQQGIVLQVGNDVEANFPMQISEGDKVMYNDHLADKLTIDVDGKLEECAVCEFKRDVHIIIHDNE